MGNIFKYSNVGGFKTTTHYPDMLAGNTVWNPYSPTGAYDALATVTVPSGGASSITFSGIPSTYTHLQLRSSVLSGAVDNLDMNFNGDSTGANYVRHWLWGDGSSAQATGNTNMGTAQFGFGGGSSTTPTAVITDILDYASSNKNKVLRSIGGYDFNGSGRIQFQSAGWFSTSPITSFVIKNDGGGNFSAGTSFALYGVK